jgi:hypothetical protein
MLLVRVLAWGVTLWVGVTLGGAARAELHFLEPSASAGTIQSGVSLVHRFRLVNQGDEPVEVTKLRPSCGCLKPRMKDRFVQPGAQAEIALEVNTLNQAPGDHTWTVQVEYHYGEEWYIETLRLTARIETEVSVQPAALTVFADQPVGHEVSLTDQRPHPLEIAEVRTSSPQLRGRVTSQFQDDLGHWVRKISLEVAAGYPEGRHDEVVDIITDDPDYGDLKVPVTVVKKSRQRLSAVPNQLTLRAAAAARSVPSWVVLVRDSSNEPVVVEGVESSDSAFVCHWAAGPNNLATIRISVRREAITNGEAHGVVRVRVSKPVRETVTIPVTCVLK